MQNFGEVLVYAPPVLLAWKRVLHSQKKCISDREINSRALKQRARLYVGFFYSFPNRLAARLRGQTTNKRVGRNAPKFEMRQQRDAPAISFSISQDFFFFPNLTMEKAREPKAKTTKSRCENVTDQVTAMQNPAHE